MKRVVCAFISACFLICLCACTQNTANVKEPFNLYYRANNTQYEKLNTIIAVEVRDAYGHSGDYHYLMQEYLNGPISESCTSPFPSGTVLEELNIVSNKAQIVLSEQFAALTGSDLMIACACISRTISELTDVQSVQISTVNNMLNGHDSITINRDTFNFMDNFSFEDSLTTGSTIG